MKKIFLVLFVILLVACTTVNVFSEETETVSKAEGEVEELEIDFQPSRFVDNLGKMGIGMLGIFIVMGVVIIVTTVLNKVTK